MLRLQDASFLVCEVTCDGGPAVAVADRNDLAIDLDKHSVSKSLAGTKWCAYKAAITERRVDPSVGTIAHQSKVGRTRSSIHISEGRLSRRHDLAVSLDSDS